MMQAMNEPTTTTPATPTTKPPRRRRLLARVALLLGTTFVCLLLAEVALRVAGFSYHLYPERVEFGWPDPEVIEDYYAPDPDLFWVPNKPTPYAELLEEARADDVDLVFMGCSCTQFGRFHDALTYLVETEFKGKTLPSANLACGGWSTFQGLQQLRRDVVPLAPEVIFVFYGWNDHWIGFGIEDKHVPEVNRGWLYSMQWSRVAQFVSRAVVAAESDSQRPKRVSLDDFEGNLRAIVTTARAAGITPILITAPTSFPLFDDIEQFAKLKERHIDDLDELIPLHASYVEKVRLVAAEEHAVLCDFAAFIAGLPKEEALTYFIDDGIHFTDIGGLKTGKFLLDCLRDNELLEGLLRKKQ